ncbi:hypothetical protein EHR_01405 [Enterococcus hirae ATCC 9790]|uniref:Uncharacterized protein n=1 Tax=Enterococcus hirae (strain ATCC 9790 / DSM 20160 / JCM 8729 / LMG 6399 / NBRC 3181 / NCIMB 6459 / NCDO 1258 / NCTC 12367 / WDCM 00089 / R) TaxID=768486 RepID=I6T3V2_ENTHA|nr:hypothetical protein EHR_01405 [Enterococcus hirae ATCC 9790]
MKVNFSHSSVSGVLFRKSVVAANRSSRNVELHEKE